jgi:guanylate kinase
MPSLAVTLSGPSAVGKNTILERFWRLKDRVTKRVAHTTRPPRDGEVHGVHYHFVSREEFLSRVARGEFLEWAQVYGKDFYGTTRLSLVEAQATGKDVFFDLDVQGARQIKAQMPEVISIGILPPTIAELRRRLDERNSGEDEETKLRRLKTAEDEIRQAPGVFDYFVVNDDVEGAVLRIQQLLGLISLGKRPPVERFRDMGHIERLLLEVVSTAPR